MKIKFSLNDQVVVKKSVADVEHYSFIPNMVGKKGKVVEIITETTVSKMPLDMPIYVVQFGEKFKRAYPPENCSACNFIPKEEDWVLEDKMHFLEDELKRI